LSATKPNQSDAAHTSAGNGAPDDDSIMFTYQRTPSDAPRAVWREPTGAPNPAASSAQPTPAAPEQPATKPGIVATAMGLARRYKRIIQALVLVAIVASLGYSLWKSGSQLTSYKWDLQWPLLLAGFALLVGQELSFALIWRGILARLGSQLDIISSERIYLGAEFVRYIPGNVWHVITRVLWAEQRGVPKPIGFASMVIELATKIASAALVFAVSLLFWPNITGLTAHVSRDAVVTIGAIAIPLLLIGLHPRLLEWTLNRGLRLLKRQPTRLTLGYGDLLLITAYWSASWVVAGAGFYLLTRAVAPSSFSFAEIAICVGVYAIGWDIGFLSFITPSGLGFREAAIAFLLVESGVVTGPTTTLAIAIATVIALIARILSTGSEIVCISGAYLVGGGRPPIAALTPAPPPQGEGS